MFYHGSGKGDLMGLIRIQLPILAAISFLQGWAPNAMTHTGELLQKTICGLWRYFASTQRPKVLRSLHSPRDPKPMIDLPFSGTGSTVS